MAFENFPYTDFHNLNLDWLLNTMKDIEVDWKRYYTEWDEWKDYVTNYIENLDYEQAINNYMNGLETSGKLSDIIDSYLGADYNVVIIGDSYGQGYTPDGNVTSWTSLLTSRYFYNQTVYTQSEGGAGFVAIGQSGNTFEKLMTKIASGMTADARKRVKYVIVAGGWNDISKQISDITGAITSFCKAAKNLFLNASVHIGFIASTGFSNIGTTEKWKDWMNTKTAYMTTFAPYEYMVGADLALRWNGVLASDYIHPNTVGQGSIADSIYKAVIGANDIARASDYIYLKGVDCSLSYDRATIEYSGHNAKIRFGDPANSHLLGLTFPTPKNLSEDTFKIMKHGCYFIHEMSQATCIAVVRDSIGYHATQCVVTMNEDNGTTADYESIKLKLVDINGGFASYTGVMSIQLYGLEFNFVMF